MGKIRIGREFMVYVTVYSQTVMAREDLGPGYFFFSLANLCSIQA